MVSTCMQQEEPAVILSRNPRWRGHGSHNSDTTVFSDHFLEIPGLCSESAPFVFSTLTFHKLWPHCEPVKTTGSHLWFTNLISGRFLCEGRVLQQEHIHALCKSWSLLEELLHRTQHDDKHGFVSAVCRNENWISRFLSKSENYKEEIRVVKVTCDQNVIINKLN